MSDKRKDGTDDPEPRITYIGSPVKSDPKQKNPKRVAASKRQAALRKGKLKLLKGETASELWDRKHCIITTINFHPNFTGIILIYVCGWDSYFTVNGIIIPTIKLFQMRVFKVLLNLSIIAR